MVNIQRVVLKHFSTIGRHVIGLGLKKYLLPTIIRYNYYKMIKSDILAHVYYIVGTIGTYLILPKKYNFILKDKSCPFWAETGVKIREERCGSKKEAGRFVQLILLIQSTHFAHQSYQISKFHPNLTLYPINAISLNWIHHNPQSSFKFAKI